MKWFLWLVVLILLCVLGGFTGAILACILAFFVNAADETGWTRNKKGQLVPDSKPVRVLSYLCEWWDYLRMPAFGRSVYSRRFPTWD